MTIMNKIQGVFQVFLLLITDWLIVRVKVR
jgi:hypothetical protein